MPLSPCLVSLRSNATELQLRKTSISKTKCRMQNSVDSRAEGADACVSCKNLYGMKYNAKIPKPVWVVGAVYWSRANWPEGRPMLHWPGSFWYSVTLLGAGWGGPWTSHCHGYATTGKREGKRRKLLSKLGFRTWLFHPFL